MKSKNKKEHNTRDLIIKIVLIVIIILLLIHNCVLQKEKDKYQNSPNGNVDVIDIKCNDNKCIKPTPTIKPSENKDKPSEPKEITSIAFANKSVSVKQGLAVKLVSIIKPTSLSNDTLTWTSSDENIVIVDSNGVIIGLNIGTATITVTTSNGKTAKVIVNVVEDVVKIDKITLNPTSLEMMVDEVSQIVATISPENATDREIIWESSDKNIATVDSEGRVVAKSVGTVTITAKTTDGKVVATSEVTIKPIPVESITISPNGITMKVGDTTQLTATVSPDNATNKEIIWSSSDDEIATVDSTGKVTGKKIGSVTITAKTPDGNVVATITVTVDNDTEDNSFKVYDEDKTPVNWNGATDLNIFTRSIYNVDGIIAPESENTYEFIVKNSTAYNIKYEIKFNETNLYDINMKYKLKKNGVYVIDHYVSASELNIADQLLSVDSKDVYHLEWKWISSSNDNSVGTNPNASYGLQIEVNAESIN